MNRELFAAARKSSLEAAKTLRKNHVEARKLGEQKRGTLRLVPESEIDKNGSHVVSFDVNHPHRARILAILERHPQSKKRRALLQKLGSSFSRIYERYRRNLQRKNGGVGTFIIISTEKRYCEEAALQCITKGVTPTQLIEYWDVHIKDWAGKGLAIPPLSFLKNGFAVDQVACSLNAPKSRINATGTQLRSIERNRFGDEDGLDKSLRKALEAAGFETQAYPDRHLLTIQHTAMALASGKDILIPHGKIRPLILWAARNLYAIPA